MQLVERMKRDTTKVNCFTQTSRTSSKAVLSDVSVPSHGNLCEATCVCTVQLERDEDYILFSLTHVADRRYNYADGMSTQEVTRGRKRIHVYDKR